MFKPDTAYAVRHPYRYTIRPNAGTSFGRFTSNWDDAGVTHSYSLMSAPTSSSASGSDKVAEEVPPRKCSN